MTCLNDLGRRTNTGLTVIRRPNVEYQYKIASAYANRG
jgi:hypothetical protein